MNKLAILFLMMVLCVSFASAATITITPSNPTDSSSLTCDVSDSTGSYIYKWFKNGNFVLQSASAVSTHTLAASYTTPGETWTCKAYAPPVPILGMIYKGQDSVTIASGTPTPTNHAPTWTKKITSQQICSYQTFSYTIIASDSDGDSITYSVSPNDDVELCDWNGLFSFDGTCYNVGAHTFTFTATDEHGASTSFTTTITVDDCGLCSGVFQPTLKPIGDKYVCPLDTITITPAANYQGYDKLHYYVSSVPDGGSWTDSTHTFKWTPPLYWAGNPFQITFWVEDEHCNHDAEAITIHVKTLKECGLETNTPPVLNQIGDRSVCYGSKLSFTVSGSDANSGDTLTYSISGKPSGATFSGQTFTWTPTSSQVGSYSPTFTVSDGKATDSETIIITVKDCSNKCPVLQPVSIPAVCVGQSINYQLVASDANGDSLTYSYSPLLSGADLCSWNGIFSWTPTCNDVGSHTETFKVSDGTCSDSETATIVVNECGKCNKPPVLNLIGNKEWCVGTSHSFTVSGSDQDGDTLTYSASGVPSGANWNPSTRIFSWTPASIGTYYVTFTVTDAHGLTDSETISIVVKNCNVCPVLQPVSIPPVCVGDTINYQLIASDANGDSLTYSYSPLLSGADLCSWNGIFSWTPTCNDVGSHTETFKVSDGTCSDSETATIVVNECGKCNKPPVLNTIGNKQVCADKTLSFSISGSDSDGDTLTYSASGLPNGASFNPSTRTFSWTPAMSQIGYYYLTFTVTDAHGATDYETIRIDVTKCNVCPVLQPVSIPAICVGQSINYQLIASDANGDSLTYSFYPSLPGAEICSWNGIFAWTPTCNDVGSHTITFTASDGTCSDSETGTIVVNECGKCNTPPVLKTIGDREVCYNNKLTFSVSATDANGDVLTYSASGLPSGALFSGQTFTWTPTKAQIGYYYVTFSVSDGKASDSETIKITVKDCNACPILQPVNIPAVCVGETINYQLLASDANGDSLTYSYSPLISGAEICSWNGIFSWTPTCNDVGSRIVTFSASDGTCSDSENATIVVNECGKCNTPPVLKLIGDKEICYGNKLTFGISATDANGDALTYSISGKPSGANFTGQTFTWLPTKAQVGVYYVTFSVSDGKSSDSETIKITVKDCNACPTLQPVNIPAVCVGQTINYQLLASDPNGDSLTYSYSPLISGAEICSWNGIFSWTPTCSDIGSRSVTFSASDGTCSDSENATIVVNECGMCNTPPVLNLIGDKEICYGNKLTFSISATDANGDALTYSISGKPSGANFTGQTFTWLPTKAQVGVYYVTFSVSDGKASDSETIKITVKDCNACPTLQPVNIPAVCVGETINYQLLASDANGDSLTYSYSPLISGAEICSWNGIFSWTPTCNDVGSHTITFTASDGTCSDSETGTIVVNECGMCNTPPVLNLIGDKEICYGKKLEFSISGSDSDGDSLIYSVSGKPNGASFAGQTFTWTPTKAQIGYYYVTFNVSDGKSSDSETIKITVNDCNACPTLQPVNIPAVCVGETINYQLLASDANGDALTYSYSPLISGAEICSWNGIFSWTPTCNDVGSHTITFTASDGTCSDSENATIVVNECGKCNTPPVLKTIGDKEVCYGSKLSFTVSGSDADGDNLTYSISGKPNGASFTGQTFTWLPTQAQVGYYYVSFYVSDGTASDSETIKVTVKDCNSCTTLQPVSIGSVCVGQSINYQLVASDANGDTITYSYLPLISGATLCGWNGIFSWTPSCSDVGSHTITFKATDGICGDSETATIVVNECGECSPVADFTFAPASPKVGQNVAFDGSLSYDPNGLTLTYAWDFNNDGITDATGVDANKVFSTAGCRDVKLTVNNGYASASKTKQVCVQHIDNLDVDSINCFDKVIINSKQSCSAALTKKIGAAELKFYDYSTNDYIGSCMTDALTGACTLNFDVHEIGLFKIYVKAFKDGYLPDEDKIPYDEYEVIKKRYDIKELKVYNDNGFSVEDYDFFRAETMYVKFKVWDILTSEYSTDDVVTKASLVSPPGGRADLLEYKPSDGYYYYYLRIPPTHGFLGTSQVFAFAFNFNDNSGGEMFVDLTIRNNPPEILQIPAQVVTVNTVTQIDLSPFKNDIEDSGNDLSWQISGIDSRYFNAELNGDLLIITSKNVAVTTSFTLKLTDLDKDSDEATVGLIIDTKKFPPIANPNGPYRYYTGQQVQFDSSGSRDPDGGSITYSWSFGDGATSTEANPVHVYSNIGIYTVTLTITDDEGESATASTHAYIEVYVKPEDLTSKDDLIIKHFEIGQRNIVCCDSDDIPVYFMVENNGPKDVKRAEITIMSRELGLYKTFKNVDIDQDETVSKFVSFTNPGAKGTYTMMVHLQAGELERTRFVEFQIR